MLGVKGYVKKSIECYNNLCNIKKEENNRMMTIYYNKTFYDEVSKYVGDCVLNACKGYFVSKDIKFGDTSVNKNIKEEMISYVIDNAELGRYVQKVVYYEKSWVFYLTCEERTATDRQFASNYFSDMLSAMKKLCDYLVEVVLDAKGKEHLELMRSYR